MPCQAVEVAAEVASPEAAAAAEAGLDLEAKIVAAVGLDLAVKSEL